MALSNTDQSTPVASTSRPRRPSDSGRPDRRTDDIHTPSTSAPEPGGCSRSADEPSRERQVIAAFEEITAEAIADAQLEYLLRSVGRKLCKLLGVTRCSLYLRQPDGRFRGAAGHCEVTGDITEAVKRQESGVVGDHFSREIITTQRPVLISDVIHDPRPHRRTMEHWRVRAMLGVPLIFAGEVIGLIFVDNRERDHFYTVDDIETAEMFARLSALFISQAVLNARLQSKKREIARRKNALGYLAEVHSKLTNAVLEGADIQTVLRLLSELSAKPVVLYSQDFRVLTWAAPPALKMNQPPAISRQVREIPSVKEQLQSLNSQRPSAIVPSRLAVGLGRRHLMCQLVIEGQPSGFLGVVEVGRGIEPLDAKVAEHGATVLSLQILSERRQVETEGQARDDYLSDLLRSTRDKQHLIRRGLQFGIDLSQPHVLVRFSLDTTPVHLTASNVQGVVTYQFRDVLRIPAPPAVRLPGAVIVLVPLPRGGEHDEFAELRVRVGQIRDQLAGVLFDGIAVVSGVCRDVGDFSVAHREIREVADTARAFGWRQGVLSVDELGLLRLVVRSSRVDDAVHFAHNLVHSVRERDGALYETWRAFVSSEGRVQAAAKTLNVHENTVRYRLGKIKEIIGQDPASLDSLLSAKLAFKVLDLSED